MNKYDIIRRPILSEKTFDGIKSKCYVFEVVLSATKPQIKAAIEEIFKVKVESVRTAQMPGKPKRQGKNEGYTSDWKKAYVQLKDDSKAIEFFEGLQ